MSRGQAREVSGSYVVKAPGGNQKVRYRSAPPPNSPQLQIQVQVCESQGKTTPRLMLALAMVCGGTISPDAEK